VTQGFGIFLQRLLDDLDISPPGLARLMGRTERTVYYWLRSGRVPRDAAALLSDALEIPLADLRRAAAGDQELPAFYRDRRRLKARLPALQPLPERKGDERLSPTVAAAMGSGRSPVVVANYDAAVGSDDEVIPEFESVPAGPLGVCDIEQMGSSPGESGRFKVRVRGRSMSPDYPDGCRVVFSRPRAMAEGVVDDKDYLVWTTTEESTFKRLIRDPADPWQYLLLRPLNPDRDRFPETRLHRRQVAYIARAVRKEIDVP